MGVDIFVCTYIYIEPTLIFRSDKTTPDTIIRYESTQSYMLMGEGLTIFSHIGTNPIKYDELTG